MQGRYKFVDWFGMPRGLNNTDKLQEAIKTADDFQCEVFWNYLCGYSRKVRGRNTEFRFGAYIEAGYRDAENDGG